MDALFRRIAGALLAGFGTFFVMLPVACCGLVIANEHVSGDVETNGPGAILGAMAIAGIAALLMVCFVMVKSRRRND
jgi:ABC-type Fe3+ transport system permease subunit